MVTFVTMAGLSESKPSFQMKQERKLGEVRKGFTHFSEGDVLFAKITPCMENGKGAVATGLRNRLGCGTTALHVIRPRNGVNPYCLYRFLSQASVRRAAKDSFTGTAGQARVPTAFITELEVTLAPPAEQLRIADKLKNFSLRLMLPGSELATSRYY
jgi:type I restriction enzyme S subunit